MALKQRNQNPLENDTVRLGFCVFNGGSFADPESIPQVTIYKLFSTEQDESNPLGRSLVTTIAAPDIVHDDVGRYHTDVNLVYPLFTQGRYVDEWSLVLDPNSETVLSNMNFTIYPNTWYTDAFPIIHDFNFRFKPNRVSIRSKKYLDITITPDVPRGTDAQRYYENMVIGGNLYISIEQKCGDDLPYEEDLRLIVDRELITERDGCHGYYFIDTTDSGPGFHCAIYNIWFEMDLGPNVFISDKEVLQIYS